MFRFADRGVVMWPVQLRQVSEAGEVEEVEVLIGYRLLPRAKLRERERAAVVKMAERAGQGAQTLEELVALCEAATEREAESEALLMSHVMDWRGVGDAGAELPFTPERFRALIEYDPFYKPILAGLHEASRHGARKNSQPGPGGMPARDQA